MDDVLVAKICSIFLLGIIALILGLLPIKILERFDVEKLSDKSKKGKIQLFLTGINCFGAGVILTTSLTHMLPDSRDVLEDNYHAGTLADPGVPLGEILIICGFLMIYITEEAAHTLLHKIRKSKDDEGKPIENGATPTQAHVDELPTDILTEATFQSALRGFFIILALSLHAIFEGIAMGLGQKASVVWYLCFAIAAHKFIIVFCVGLQVRAGTKTLA